MKRVKIVRVDDWEAVYLDGKSVFQNHSVRIEDLKSFLPGDITLNDIEEEYRVDLEDVEFGQLPELYSDLESQHFWEMK